MSIHYKKLFEPIKIGSVEIKNRIFMSPMGPVGFAEGNGAFTKAGQEYYIERARGGTGLIMTGTVNVDYNEILPGGLPCPTVNPVAFTQSALDMLNSVHSLGAKFFLQLSGGLGRSAFPGATSQHIAPSPALNRFDPRIQHREMTHEEIQTLIANFVKAAVIAKGAGFDGIEIHAVHEGYLLDQFGLSFFNQRTDEYGGSLENRLRIATQIVQGIKQACGKDFPVGLRFSPKSFLKGYAQGAVPGEEFEEKGRDYEEGIEAAKLLVAAGYDELNVDAGTYDSWYWNHPPMYFGYKGIYREFGRIVKQNVDVPVLISGRMDDPQMACDSIDECCDMVGFGRPLLADPYLPQKIADGQLDEIRPCLSCHEACMGRCSKFVHLSCAVNPQCGFEIDKPVIPTCTPKTVLVAGGGVAGMECAMILRQRGHNVVLVEKSGRLGGLLNIGGVPKFKHDDLQFIAWLERQVRKLGVDIRLNTAATPELVDELGADAVVTATGSRPIKLNIPGDGSYVMADEVLSGAVEAGKRVAIIGGGQVGCELALHLLQNGHDVAIFELTGALLGGMHGDMPFMNRCMLEDLLKFHKADIHTDSAVSSIDVNGLSYECGGEKHSCTVDTVVMAAGYTPVHDLYDSLKDCGKPVYNIGDSRKVHNIMQAVWDGFEVGRSI